MSECKNYLRNSELKDINVKESENLKSTLKSYKIKLSQLSLNIDKKITEIKEDKMTLQVPRK